MRRYHTITRTRLLVFLYCDMFIFVSRLLFFHFHFTSFWVFRILFYNLFAKYEKTPVCNWLLGKNKKENLAGNRSCSKYISKFRIVTLTGCFMTPLLSVLWVTSWYLKSEHKCHKRIKKMIYLTKKLSYFPTV